MQTVKLAPPNGHSSSAALVLVGVMEDGAGWEGFFFGGGGFGRRSIRARKRG